MIYYLAQVFRDTKSSSDVITSLVLSVDSQGNITASSSRNYNGSLNESEVNEIQSAESKEQDLYRAGREITLSGMPTWAWANATPVSKNNLPQIQNAYENIFNAMKKREIHTLEKMASISSREMGIAEGLSPDIIFSSYGLPEKILDKSLSPINLEWDDYDVTTYCNGRVFRLAQGIYQNSPLRLQNTEGKIVFAYNPYFSIIDGKVVIVR